MNSKGLRRVASSAGPGAIGRTMSGRAAGASKAGDAEAPMAGAGRSRRAARGRGPPAQPRRPTPPRPASVGSGARATRALEAAESEPIVGRRAVGAAIGARGGGVTLAAAAGVASGRGLGGGAAEVGDGTGRRSRRRGRRRRLRGRGGGARGWRRGRRRGLRAIFRLQPGDRVVERGVLNRDVAFRHRRAGSSATGRSTPCGPARRSRACAVGAARVGRLARALARSG